MSLFDVEIEEQANALVVKYKRKDKDSIIAAQQAEIAKDKAELEALRAQLAASKLVNAAPKPERQLTKEGKALIDEIEADVFDADSSAGQVTCEKCGKQFKRAGWVKDGLCKKCRDD